MPGLSQKPTAAALVTRLANRFRRAGLYYGHGTDNPRDDAAALVMHVMAIAPDAPASAWRRKVNGAALARVGELAEQRIQQRVPVAYLTQRCWFAGLPMHVDQRVLIPRSPLAETIEQRFQPWINSGRVRRICDMGTGSGCIAIACARAFPRAGVDAVDVSPQALQVARLNVAAHRLGKRVHPVLSSHFSGLKGITYDIIVSNPPYVGEAEMSVLPSEYRHEPALALAAGRDGLDSVRVLLKQSPRHLRAGGILVVEVGNSEHAVRRHFRRLPFMWLSFTRGGGGVFLLTREQLVQAGR